MMKNLFFFLLCIVCLSSCSPKYSTHYTYYPIAGRKGQVCSNTCLVAKQNCVQTENLNNQNCEMQANFQQQMCEASKQYGYDSDGDLVCVANCFCSRTYCRSPNFAFCEETYKECYLNCGGDVAATTACVRNCDEANPPVTQRLRKNEYGSIVDVTGEVE